jgi:glutathione S-transferase
VSEARLTINSRRYGAWSLRGWLMCCYSGLDFEVELVDGTDPESRAELLLLSASFLVPALHHGDHTIWDTLAIGEYLHECRPDAGLYPRDAAARALCRSVSGEVHSGFANLRSALPMNLVGTHPGFALWGGVKPDLERIDAIWNRCLDQSGGPFLFGARPSIADAMYAPECTRLVTYDIELGAAAQTYVRTVTNTVEMRQWAELAAEETDEGELEFEF